MRVSRASREQWRWGMRTISVDRSRLPAHRGSRFCIQVNGRDVFCRGGNWVPADAITGRISQSKICKLVEAAKDANFTMLRVWGGGVYEDNFFYRMCDMSGILVWQDFMFACALYPDDDPAYCQEVRREAELAVRRLRNHPSIALWCGNNENNWGFAEWWPQEPHRGAHIYGQILPEVCRTLDPDRFYWPSSPCGGDTPNTTAAGDCHWWGQATMHAEPDMRIDPYVYESCDSKFISEFGVCGPPVLESLLETISTRPLEVHSPEFQAHVNTFERDTVISGIERHYVHRCSRHLTGAVCPLWRSLPVIHAGVCPQHHAVPHWRVPGCTYLDVQRCLGGSGVDAD